MKSGLEGQSKDAVHRPDAREALLPGEAVRGMRRRDFVRVFMAATVAPAAFLGQTAPPPRPELPAAAPVPWMRGINRATPVPEGAAAETVAEAEVQFFTSTQMATLSRLSDVFLPRIGTTPGALEAGTPAFLDFFVGESPQARKTMYQDGLDWLDTESKKQFAKPFAELETAQADRLLKPWLRTWMTDHLPREPHAAFINTAHSDIRMATVNSRAWGEAPDTAGRQPTQKGLYWSQIEPDMCWSHPGANQHAAAPR